MKKVVNQNSLLDGSMENRREVELKFLDGSIIKGIALNYDSWGIIVETDKQIEYIFKHSLKMFSISK